MFCPKCGKIHGDRYVLYLIDNKVVERKYCDECGFKLNWENERQW